MCDFILWDEFVSCFDIIKIVFWWFKVFKVVSNLRDDEVEEVK